MRDVLGWAALVGSALCVLGGIRAAHRGRWGPYEDVLSGMFGGPPPDVPREWKLAHYLIAALLYLAGIGLLLLGAHLLPEVAWLERFRVFRPGA